MRRRTASTLAVCAVLLAACSGDGDGAPAPTTRPVTPTTVVDLTGVSLGPVAGATTTTAPPERGEATIAGIVTGPDGPLPGATVRFERVHGDQIRRTDVQADEAGRYALRGVPGGRYRIRAFSPPAFVQLQPVIRFLEDRQEHRLDLTVEDHGGVDVRASVAPNPPTIGFPLQLAVRVGIRTVDGDGILRTEPVSGVRVELAGLGVWEPPDGSSGLSATTDGEGIVSYLLECRAGGSPGLFVRIPVRRPAAPGQSDPTDPGAPPPAEPDVQVEQIPLDLSGCADPVPATTAAPDPADDGDGTGGDEDGDEDERDRAAEDEEPPD